MATPAATAKTPPAGPGDAITTITATFHPANGKLTHVSAFGRCTFRGKQHGSISQIERNGRQYVELILTSRQAAYAGSLSYVAGTKPSQYQVDLAWNGKEPQPIRTTLTESGHPHRMHLKSAEIDAYDAVRMTKKCRPHAVFVE